MRVDAMLSPSMQLLLFCRRVNDERVVDRADVAVREVDRVVADVQRHEIRDIDGAAEELDAVVIGAVDLEVLDVVPEPTALNVTPFSSSPGATSKPVCLTTT